MKLENQTIARAPGKSDLHNPEPEDLCALDLESVSIAILSMAGTNWIPRIKDKKLNCEKKLLIINNE